MIKLTSLQNRLEKFYLNIKLAARSWPTIQAERYMQGLICLKRSLTNI